MIEALIEGADLVKRVAIVSSESHERYESVVRARDE